jgi:hypothetical protein
MWRFMSTIPALEIQGPCSSKARFGLESILKNRTGQDKRRPKSNILKVDK